MADEPPVAFSVPLEMERFVPIVSGFKAPVEVPYSYDNPCPNYSSALLPVQNGSGLLEFASDFYELRKCGTYFATKSWAEIMPAKTKTAP